MSTETRVEPRKRPTQRRSQETVDAILAATARVLVEDGYDGTSTNRIAKLAGVSVGSLYQYFPNKQALLLALVRRHSERMLDLLRATTENLATAPIPDVVRTYVGAMVAAHAVDPALHRVLIPQLMALGLHHLDEFQRPVLAIVRAWLELHRHEILPKNLDVAAFVLVASVEAATHGAYLDVAIPEPDPDALREEVSALVLRYLLGEAC